MPERPSSATASTMVLSKTSTLFPSAKA